MEEWTTSTIYSEKKMDSLFYETIKKYGWAISQNLHPSQTKKLKEALKAFEKSEEIYISDCFVKVVYDMIIADLLYQKQK